MRRIAAASLIAVAGMLACAPREGSHSDSTDSAAAATAASAALASPATTPAESAAVSSASTATRAPATKSSSTRTAPEDSGRIIGRDSARTIDPRDPKRRLPVVPPSKQR